MTRGFFVVQTAQKERRMNVNERDTAAALSLGLAGPAYAQPSRAEPLRDDLIWGGEGIAEEIGKSQRQVFHLISIGAIPAAKVGGRIVASRSRLREHFRTLLDAARA
jgi:hypothetical protein